MQNRVAAEFERLLGVSLETTAYAGKKAFSYLMNSLYDFFLCKANENSFLLMCLKEKAAYTCFGLSFSSMWNSSGRIYVWLDNCNYCESKYKGFYYVRYQLSMLDGGTTAYAHPELVVEKKKLRPDQVEYMERKCQETLAAGERLNRKLEEAE